MAKRLALLSIVVGMTWMLVSCQEEAGLDYPSSRTAEVVDTYFGTEVADPYRWLEGDTTAEVRDWVQRQVDFTEAYLSQIPFRAPMQARLTDLIDYDKEGSHFFTGEYYLYFRKDGLSNQSVLYITERLGEPGRVLLDPNKFSEDGTVALTSVSVSRDSKFLAYSVADGGSDWQIIRVLDVATGETLPDEIRWVKFSNTAWHKDGFYYSCYDAPKAGTELSGKNEYHKVYYHRLGTSQDQDRLIYENPSHPLRNYVAEVTGDKYLFISESETTDGNALFFRNLETQSDIVQLTNGFDYDYLVVGSRQDCIFMRTNFKAPNYRLVRIDMDQTDIGSWEDVIPESEHVLSSVTLTKTGFVATHMVDASDRMTVYDLEGKPLRTIDLGVLGSVVSVQGRPEDEEIYFSYSSFTVPTVAYAYNTVHDSLREVFRPEMDVDFSKYKVEQVFFASKDGTRVPMFLVYRADLPRDGANPTLLYGYGGFNISLTPSFSASRMAWLEQGGVYAVANLRGGGEYGDRWHMQGTKLLKQNVFDDFIAAAEYLIAENITSPKYLAIQGGSNGGLLIGAVVNQRPDLFGVAIPQVGVMDMLRYQHFTIGWAWSGDYGTSDQEDQFENLYGYSPLHNIQSGSNYPAVLVTTADHDDRVVPAHSFKYVATLQARQPKGAPKLVRIETRAGHGAGKPTALAVAEITDIYSFIFHNMGLRPEYGGQKAKGED